MITFLVFLLLFTASIIIVPVALTNLGLDLDPWVLNAIAAFIGSLVAIIGSIVINLLTDRKKRNKAYKRELNLLKLELYNNFVLSIHNITNEKKIPYDNSIYQSFIQFVSSKEEEQFSNITKELQVLYFIIQNGNELLTKYKDFNNTVFNLEHKNPDGFVDMFEIVRSKSLDSVYEFSVLKGIITLNSNFDLNLRLPFNNYDLLIDEYDNTLSQNDRIKLYISELICKGYFKDEERVFLLDLIDETRDDDETV